MKKILSKNYLWFLLTFAIVMAVYLLTLCPAIYLEDSAEYATVAFTVGISHPPGYPLYALLGKLFTFIPWGTIAWRVNLMSAFFGALTCAFLFLVIQKIFRQKNGRMKKRTNERTEERTNEDSFFVTLLLYYLLPLSCSLIFAFTQIFWSQSVVAEVYTLNTFFVAMIFWLLLIWAEKIRGCHSDDSAIAVEEESRGKKYEEVSTRSLAPNESGLGMTTEKREKLKNKADKILLLTIFLYGISLTNHQMMLLILPAFLVFVLWHDWRLIKDYKFIFAAAFLFIIGISLYLYLPIRAAQNPSFNWGNLTSFEGLKNHILRRQYNDLHMTWGSFFDAKKWPIVDGFSNATADQFTVVGIIIALLGFIVNYFRNKKIFFLILGIFLGNSLLIILIRAAEYSPMSDFVFRVYYLPAFMMVAIWLAWGLKYLLEILLKIKKDNLWRKIYVKLGIIIFLLILPLSFLINNYQKNDRSDFWLLNDWARNTLLSLEPKTVLMGYNDQPAFDSMLFSLMYMQAVENLRRDVKIVNFAGIRGIFFGPANSDAEEFSKWTEKERREMIAVRLWEFIQKDQKNPLYILYSLGRGKNEKLTTRSNGFAYKVYENLATAKKDEKFLALKQTVRNLDYPALQYNVFYSDLVSDYYFGQASYYLENGEKKLSGKDLLKAIEYDTSPFSFNYQAFIEHRAVWNGETLKNNKK
jgi:4-amino-4-deoxy-L-arabinose transferase-like glycosyltransferase